MWRPTKFGPVATIPPKTTIGTVLLPLPLMNPLAKLTVPLMLTLPLMLTSHALPYNYLDYLYIYSSSWTPSEILFIPLAPIGHLFSNYFE